MFLIISNDGVIKKAKKISKEWLREADVAIIDIIDISDPNNPIWYYQDGQWTEVEDL